MSLWADPRPRLPAYATSRPLMPSCDCWRRFAVCARERGGPLPSIAAEDALLDERRELVAGVTANLT